MDGLLHAQRSWIIGITQWTFGDERVSDALDPVCGKPGDDHWGDYAVCRPHKVGISPHSSGGSCGGKCSDVAGHAPRRTRHPSIRRRWICPRRGYAFHGADRHFDGGSVCTYGTAPVWHLMSEARANLLPGSAESFNRIVSRARWRRLPGQSQRRSWRVASESRQKPPSEIYTSKCCRIASATACVRFLAPSFICAVLAWVRTVSSPRPIRGALRFSWLARRRRVAAGRQALVVSSEPRALRLPG